MTDASFNLSSAPHGFIPEDLFSSCRDLDGASAARFLTEHGALDVTHKDLGTNGLATGRLPSGDIVKLSTNGYFRRVAQRYVAKSIHGGWWAVFDSQTGCEETFPDGDLMGPKADATALAARLNAA